MRIAIVSPFNPASLKEMLDSNDVPCVHEVATSVNNLVAALIKQGHKVFVYTSMNMDEKMISYKGNNVKVVIASRNFHPSGMTYFRVAKRLRDLIAKDLNEIDIIHAHWTYEYAAAARSFDSQKKVFCSIRDWCPYQKTFAKSFWGKYDWFLKGILFAYVMNSRKVQFIANSKYTYNMARSVYPLKKIEIIPNPIQRKFIIQEKKKTKGPLTFITICQSVLEKRKNISTLIDAFNLLKQKITDCKLIIIGSYSQEWKERYRDKLEGVVLIGRINHDAVYEYIDQADILVHSSLEETFGNIFLEAMARRVVCIGGRESGAVPEVLGNGLRGFLCDVRKVDDLAETMEKATQKVHSDPLIDNATDYLLNEYADDVIAGMHIKLYENCLLEKK